MRACHFARTMRLRSFAVFVILAALSFPASPRAANAAGITITVTTTEDELTSNGQCSLREAIRAANTDTAVDACGAGSGPDTIRLSNGLYTLSTIGQDEDAGMTGDLDVRADLTITGVTSDTTIIDGGHLDRVLHVLGAPMVQIEHLTVQHGGGGSSFPDAPPISYGGGIANTGTLVIRDSTISNNFVFSDYSDENPPVNSFGAGISNSGRLVVINSRIHSNMSRAEDVSQPGGGIANTGDATISNSSIENNFGSGIDNRGTLAITKSIIASNRGRTGAGVSNRGSLSVAESVFSDNSTYSDFGAGTGGAIKNHSGNIIIVRSRFSNNSAGIGGDIDQDCFFCKNVGRITITDSIFAGGGGIANHEQTRITITNSIISYYYGDGIYNEGVMMISHSTINRSNVAGDSYSSRGVFNFGGNLIITDSTIDGNGGSGGIMNSSTFNDPQPATMFLRNVTITNSRVSGNGGGITNRGSRLTIMNSTISGNSATGDGGGIYNSTEFQKLPSIITISNVTVANNTADSDQDGIGDGGGIFNVSGNRLYARNTILANNIDAGGQVLDCAGSLTSQGYNLISNQLGCILRGYTSGNQYGKDPRLGPLQDNGGPTWTHALLPASPAIDAANWSKPGSGGYACEPRDQRGVLRPQEGDGQKPSRCDIGAYEYQAQSHLTDEENVDAPAVTSAPEEGTNSEIAP
jgi:CSLREA domain-containing protein